jgi:hypothetical protein
VLCLSMARCAAFQWLLFLLRGRWH